LENFYFYINFINQNLENSFYLFFLIYFFSLIFFFSLSIPGGAIPLLASGFFFGFYIGFAINIISMLIGSYFFVFLARTVLRKFFNKFHYKYSNKISNLIKHASYEYLIIFRLIQGNPLFVQNLCLSFLNISKIKLITSSFVGFIPVVFICSYLGSKLSEIYEIKNLGLREIFTKEFNFFIITFLIFLIIRVIYKLKKNKEL
jgi:Uncharacterized conserved protein